MITLPKFVTGGGSFGDYYQLSKSVGVKVLSSHRFKSMKDAFKSKAYRRAMKEAELLNMAYESGVVPQCYGVTLVREGKTYGVGIVMQHLGNKTLFSHGRQESLAYDTVNDALMDLGIQHGDLHDHNIMVYRGKFYAIDFSPECVRVLDR